MTLVGTRAENPKDDMKNKQTESYWEVGWGGGVDFESSSRSNILNTTYSSIAVVPLESPTGQNNDQTMIVTSVTPVLTPPKEYDQEKNKQYHY